MWIFTGLRTSSVNNEFGKPPAPAGQAALEEMRRENYELKQREKVRNRLGADLN